MLSGRWQRKCLCIAVVSPSLSQCWHCIANIVALLFCCRGCRSAGNASSIALLLHCHANNTSGIASPLCPHHCCGAGNIVIRPSSSHSGNNDSNDDGHSDRLWRRKSTIRNNINSKTKTTTTTVAATELSLQHDIAVTKPTLWQ